MNEPADKKIRLCLNTGIYNFEGEWYLRIEKRIKFNTQNIELLRKIISELLQEKKIPINAILETRDHLKIVEKLKKIEN